MATGYEQGHQLLSRPETHGGHAAAGMSSRPAPGLAESLSVSAENVGSGYEEVGRAQYAKRGEVGRAGFDERPSIG